MLPRFFTTPLENTAGITGFNFTNCSRNREIVNSGYIPPVARSTGTCIVAFKFNGGVMIGADTRHTLINKICSDSAKKIQRLQDNIFCAGAGIAGDVDMMRNVVEAQLELHHLNTQRQVPVICANKMFRQALYRYGGSVSANFVIAGIDRFGSDLYCTRHEGCSDHIPYITLGSGQLAAMGFLENRWHDQIDLDEAIKLMCDAICAAIDNDLLSGGGVELCVMHDDGTIEHCHQKLNVRAPSMISQLGVIPILRTIIVNTTPVSSAPPPPQEPQPPEPSTNNQQQQQQQEQHQQRRRKRQCNHHVDPRRKKPRRH